VEGRGSRRRREEGGGKRAEGRGRREEGGGRRAEGGGRRAEGGGRRAEGGGRKLRRRGWDMGRQRAASRGGRLTVDAEGRGHGCLPSLRCLFPSVRKSVQLPIKLWKGSFQSFAKSFVFEDDAEP
jgi:hypothetical protein